MLTENIKVCYFPGRETDYARNRVLLNGMRKCGLTVYDCSYHKKSFVRYFVGFYRFLKFKNKCDIVFIGFLGQFLVPLARLCTRKKILFDAFVSVYQTMAFDRQVIAPQGVLAFFARALDKLSCQLADHVILDTDQHIQFFLNEYKLNKNKFSRVLVGSDDTIVYPRNEINQNEFIVHFHGAYQSLHGAEHIIEAAAQLPDVTFQMIGDGMKLNECQQKAKELNLKNIKFIPTLPYGDLLTHMARASVCLGLLGKTQKANLVIPHKAYEALAMAKPLITSDTPAIRELLHDGEDVVLCKAGDSQSLIKAIMLLRNDPAFRKRIAENGYKTFKENCTTTVIGQRILEIIKTLV